MSITRKQGATSPDGEVQAKIEHYVDDTCSRAIITATYRGRSGQVVFTATEAGVDVSFAADEVSASGKNMTLTAGENMNLSGSNAAIQGSENVLVSAGKQALIQALTGIIELSAGKSMKLGAMEKIQLRAKVNMLLEALQKIEIITTQLRVQSQNIRLGTGTRTVACVGDSVSGGVISGPGSLILRTD